VISGFRRDINEIYFLWFYVPKIGSSEPTFRKNITVLS
jgi:hypothetical protein